MKEKTTDIIENMLEEAAKKERANKFAGPREYEVLLKLIAERGVMPADLSALCSLLYRTQFATLSRSDARDLQKRIANVPADQQAMRFWISNTVTGMMSGWVNEGKEA